jgi:rhamnose utilization protein RhaD (predicted bifunctional aldolase and dehydrogenase)
MKAVLAAIVLLSSSMSFALTDDEAVSTLIISCSIEKLCAAGTATPFDTAVSSGKAAASLQLGGADCATPEVAAILADPTFTTELKGLVDALAANGATTCLAAAVTTP